LAKAKLHSLTRRSMLSLSETPVMMTRSFDDEVFLLAFARLAVCDGGFLQGRTRRACLQQARRRLVDRGTKERSWKSPCRQPPPLVLMVASFVNAPGRRKCTSNFVFLLGVEGFPFDIHDRCKDVDAHRDTPKIFIPTDGQTRSRYRNFFGQCFESVGTLI